MTNSFFPAIVNNMFPTRLIFGVRKERRIRTQSRNVVDEQVKKLLQTADQKLILMVRS